MKTSMVSLKTFFIAIVIVSIIGSFIAGFYCRKSYYAGRRDGYKIFCDEHKDTLDSLSAEYKVAIRKNDQAYNKLHNLYEAELETLRQTQKPIK